MTLTLTLNKGHCSCLSIGPLELQLKGFKSAPTPFSLSAQYDSLLINLFPSKETPKCYADRSPRNTICYLHPWMGKSSVENQKVVSNDKARGSLMPSWLSAEAPYASQNLGRTHRRSRAREALTQHRVRGF